jgi:basic membrane protein A and related proteins
MKKSIKLGLLFMVMVLMVMAASVGWAADSKFKVGFVNIGSIGDAGWTFAHDQARKYLEKQLPNVETTFVESVPEGADAEKILTDLAEKGNQVIFATSFGYMDSVIKVAARYPKVVFMHCSGYKTAKNVGVYMNRDYEGWYLAGVAAAKYVKKNVAGYVAPYPLPEIVRSINAFTLGARSVNSKIKVKVVWTNTWYDPQAEKAAALSLIHAGAGLIASGQDTPAAMQAAQEKGVYGISYNSDMRAFAPKAIVTGHIVDWGPYYVKVVKSVMQGTWKSSDYFGGLADGLVGLAPYGPMVTTDVKSLVDKKKSLITKDDWMVFAGPLQDQSGKIRVKAGQKMTDPEILSLNWFVNGVEGTIPK